ncbi:MAG: TonB-dependent receptor [Acidobacteriota bacterium]|nr:TonB-dependent receptor [Acidobacteriota bacterium]
MTRSLGVKFAALILVICCGSLALAQSMTTALRGQVENENAGLPGVLVTLKSPVLQGVRTTTTSANGDYSFAGIPPGDYTVTFALQGFQAVTKTIKLTAGQPAIQDAALALSGISTATTVSAKAETVSTTTQASTTLTSEITSKLPVGRTILASVGLSSGLNQVTSLGGAAGVTVSGGQTFDNLFTVDGAVIMDNIRGTPNNLFIEDAIQETTTSVNSVSAEFGRFTGGVINTVTKSGGNQFSGSFRTSFTNDAWTAISPSGETRIQKVNPVYEATLGGPLWKDHVWFFGSGRLAKVTGSGQTSFTNIPFETLNDNKRYQGKITITPFASQTFAVNYLKVEQTVNGNSFGTILDLDSLVNGRQDPQEILTANYNGVITSNFFVEGLYSRRKYTFINAGSLYTDLIKGTLMRDQSRGNARYNAPTFCGVCDPESRDNKDYLVKGTYFLSTSGLGSHNIVLGYDHFAGSRKANNYQSGSNYRLFATGAIIQGGDIFPVVGPSSYIYYTPIDTLSKGSDALTHSVFLNDAWRVNDRLSANLGVRYDKNNAADSRGVITSKDSALSPRLALQFDVSGKGTVKLGASYAKYVGGLQETLLDSASNAGRNSTFYWYYTGAGATPINVNPPAGAPLVTRAEALQQVFNWFFGNGCPNLTTCKLPLGGAAVAGLSTQIPADGLNTPYANEYTLGVTGSMGQLSYRADVVRREFKESYYTLLNLGTGQVADPFGHKFDLGIQGNTNDLVRNYTGLQTQFQYRTGRLTMTANWTWSHTLGNNDGETNANGPITNGFKTYPEYKDPAWNNPTGSLVTDQRHRVRIFGSYELPFIPQKFGSMSVGLVQSYDTGAPYGAVGTVRSRDFITNPGYATRPSSVTYYYTARDAFRTDDIKRTDLSLNFATKIGPVEIFVQPQVINVFNNQGKIAVDQTVQTFVNTTGYLNFNPFTTVPVQGARNTAAPSANWNTGPNFGNARSVNDYQIPRTFQATVGLRF